VTTFLTYCRRGTAFAAAHKANILVALLLVLTSGIAACGTKATVYQAPSSTRRDSGRPPEDEEFPPEEEADAGEPPIDEPDAGAGADASVRVDAGADAAPPFCAQVRVMVMTNLNVRATPSTTGTILGDMPNGAVADVLNKVRGDAVMGNDVWYQVQRNTLKGYVSAFYVSCLP
jgi:hypothetical protein